MFTAENISSNTIPRTRLSDYYQDDSGNGFDWWVVSKAQKDDKNENGNVADVDVSDSRPSRPGGVSDVAVGHFDVGGGIRDSGDNGMELAGLVRQKIS